HPARDGSSRRTIDLGTRRSRRRDHHHATLRATHEPGNRPGPRPDRTSRQHALPASHPPAARTTRRQFFLRRQRHLATPLVSKPLRTADDEGSAYDEQMALLLTELTDRAQRGERVDLEEECRKHPDFS